MRPLGLSLYTPSKAYHGYTLFSSMEDTYANLIDMRGNIVHRWQLEYRPGDYGYLLENGNLLIAGRTELGPVAIGGRSGIITEFNWEGEKVWEWHAYEHLDPEDDYICPIHRRDEWTHTNTCKVLPDGNVMTSWRLLDQVAIIDKSSGDFIWKWGRGVLGHQHDPNLLDNGNVLIFDNGWHSMSAPTPSSRIIEVDPGSGEIQWEYKTRPGWEFFSGFISGAQRLPNGNTLICEGMTGRLFEVTHDGEMVWQYVNPFFGYDERFGHANRVFRTYRYGPAFPGLAGKDLNPERFARINSLYQR